MTDNEITLEDIYKEMVMANKLMLASIIQRELIREDEEYDLKNKKECKCSDFKLHDVPEQFIRIHKKTNYDMMIVGRRIFMDAVHHYGIELPK